MQGDKLAIFEETSYEWTVAEQGCYSQNITVLTVYANLGIEALTFALEQADVTYLLTNASLLKTVCFSLQQFFFKFKISPFFHFPL